MFSKRLVSRTFTWWVSYDYKSLEHCPEYDGPISMDYYGRLHPKHNNGTVRLQTEKNSIQLAVAAILPQFDAKTDHRLLFRRLGVCAVDVAEDGGAFQQSFFIDYSELEKENRLRAAMQQVRAKYGANAVFKGMSLLDGATLLERNQQIGVKLFDGEESSVTSRALIPNRAAT